MRVKKGEFVCIIGELGSGKSSLISSVIGDMIFVPENEITVAGGQSGRKLTKDELQSLRHNLLNDVKIKDSPVKLGSSISYVEQQPWI